MHVHNVMLSALDMIFCFPTHTHTYIINIGSVILLNKLEHTIGTKEKFPLCLSGTSVNLYSVNLLKTIFNSSLRKHLTFDE